MTKAYIEYSALIEGITSRKYRTEAKVSELRGLIGNLEAEYDTATITGAPTDDIVKDLDELRADLAKAERDASVFQKAEGELGKIIKSNTRITDLANTVMRDNAESIAKLKAAFEELHKRLAPIKAEFLKTVAAMGAINAEAASLSHEQNDVKKYISGKETIFYGGLGVDPKGPEDIYLQAADIQKTFKEGKM